MADKYTIDVITDIEKKQLVQIAETAIANLRRKIAEIKQMIVDEKGMQTFNKPYEVAYYIKEAIGIPNRQVQDDNNIDEKKNAKNKIIKPVTSSNNDKKINRDLYEISGILFIIVLIRLFSKQFIKQSNRVKVYE